jgi:hypothetical protein
MKPAQPLPNAILTTGNELQHGVAETEGPRLVARQAFATVSIDSYGPYRLQRDCVKCLLWVCYGGVLGVQGCGRDSVANGYLDACYCRADNVQIALSYLSSRAPLDCKSNSVDLSSAVEVFTGYCAGKAAAGGPTTTTTPQLFGSATTMAPSSKSIFIIVSVPLRHIPRKRK